MLLDGEDLDLDTDDEPTPEFVPTLDDDDSDVVDFVPDELPSPCWALMGFVAERAELPTLTFKEPEKHERAPEWGRGELTAAMLAMIDARKACRARELQVALEASVDKLLRGMRARCVLERYAGWYFRAGNEDARALVTQMAKARGNVESKVLDILADGQSVMVRDLASRLRVSQSTIKAVVRRLVRRGLARRDMNAVRAAEVEK